MGGAAQRRGRGLRKGRHWSPHAFWRRGRLGHCCCAPTPLPTHIPPRHHCTCVHAHEGRPRATPRPPTCSTKSSSTASAAHTEKYRTAGIGVIAAPKPNAMTSQEAASVMEGPAEPSARPARSGMGREGSCFGGGAMGLGVGVGGNGVGRARTTTLTRAHTQRHARAHAHTHAHARAHTQHKHQHTPTHTHTYTHMPRLPRQRVRQHKHVVHPHRQHQEA